MKITTPARAFLVLLCLAMVFSLFACAEELTTVTDAQGTDAQTEAPEETNGATEAPTTAVTEAPTAEATEEPTEGETTELGSDVPECEAHQVFNYTEYVANPNGSTALLAGKCVTCGAKVTKPATFFAAIETIYGDVAADTVVMFQATETVSPIMGGTMLSFDNKHANYPADGFKPIRLDSTLGYAGLLGISGWGAFLGSSASATAAYRFVDQEGNVLVDWTAASGIDGVLPTIFARPDLDAVLPELYTEGAAGGFGYNFIIDVRPYLDTLAGKIIDVEFAFATPNGVDGDVYIPFATIDTVYLPGGCEHTAEVLAAVEATCTETGLTEGKKCSKCDEIIVAQQTVPAKGHTEDTLAAVAPTCETAGLTEGKKCSVCQTVTVEQTEVAALGHTWDGGVTNNDAACGATADITFTCTNEGCGKTRVETGATVEHAWEETARTAATCSATGTVSYKCTRGECTETKEETLEIDANAHEWNDGEVTTQPTCSAEGVKTFTCAHNAEHKTTEAVAIVAEAHEWNEGEVTTAPTCSAEGVKTFTCAHNAEHKTTEAVDIVADAHKIVEKGYMAPTTAETGHTAHKACEYCAKAWTLEDVEITDGSHVIPKVTYSTNYYFGYEELKDKTPHSWSYPNTAVAKPAADHTYVRYERIAMGGDLAVYLIDNSDVVDTVSGQYLVLKYRTNEQQIEGFAKTVAGSLGGDDNFPFAINGDGQWHVVVVNMAQKVKTAAQIQAGDDGQYRLRVCRIDILNADSDSGYFDIAFAAVTDDLSKATELLDETDKAACTHSVTHNYTWDNTTKQYSAYCVCGEILTKDMLHVTESHSTGFDPSCVTVSQNDGFVRYTATVKEGSTDLYFYPYHNGSVVTGNYVVIKYRVVNGGKTTAAARSFYAGTKGNNAQGGDSGGVTKDGSFIADGQWHFYVISVDPSKNDYFNANTDGTYTWKYLRIGFDPKSFDGSCYMDIDSLAFADCREACDAYIFNNSAGNASDNAASIQENSATVTIPAGYTYYFTTKNYLTSFAITGADVSVVANGNTYTSTEGSLTVTDCANGATYAVTNNGDATINITVNFAYPAGIAENPVALKADGSTVTNAPMDGKFYYKWTAVDYGTLYLTATCNGAWTITVNDVAYSSAEAENNQIAIKVAKSQALTIIVESEEAVTLKSLYILKLEGETVTGFDSAACTLTRDEEGNLVIQNTKKSSDVYLSVFSISGGVAGRYIAVTYKTTNASMAGHLKGIAADGTAIGWKSYGFNNVVKDGEWYTAILDVYAILGQGATVTTLRFDVCESTTADQTLYIKSIEMIVDDYIVSDKLNLNVNGAGIASSGNYGMLYTNTYGTPNVSEDVEYVRVARQTGKSDTYFRIYPKAKVEGQYLVLKYRTTADYVTGIYTSTTNADQVGGDNFSFTLKGDGEWHYAVIDLTQSKTVSVNGDGVYLVNYIRIGIGATPIDFAYIGLHDDLEEIYSKLSIPEWGYSGSNLSPTSRKEMTASRDDDGYLVLTNNKGAGSDCNACFLPTDNSTKVNARYLVLTVKANYANAAISTIYITDTVKTSLYDLVSAISLSKYEDQWVTIIVDTYGFENKRTEGAAITQVRVDTCDGSTDNSMTFKSVGLYVDIDSAVAAAGDTPIITKGFTLPTE